MDARCLLDDLEVEQVEEMYIHFYTVIYPNSPHQLSIYWYKNTQEHVEIFEDVRQIFEKMKECKFLTTYTGDVFCIKNERLFVEQLLLLGVEQKDSYQLHLINGVVKEVHHGKTNFLQNFNDLFDICFQSYDVYHSFSSSDSEHAITVLDKRDGISSLHPIPSREGDYSDKHLLIIDFFGHRVITTFIKLRTILYSIFHSIIDNQTLNKWFYRLVEKNDYATIVQTIQTMESFHREHPYEVRRESTPTLYEESSEVEGDAEAEAEAEAEGDAKEQKSVGRIRQMDTKEWIQTFCDLYLQKDLEKHTLLSEVYHDYCTASSWTSTSVVSMAQFMKTLRSLERFTIRRRSKGMVIVGYSCLIQQQASMFEDVKNQNMHVRNLLHRLSVKEMKELLHVYRHVPSTSKWTREAILMLPPLTTPLTTLIVEQFASNPYLASSLTIYANYIDNLFSKPFSRETEDAYQEYNELKKSCVLYYPFSLDIEAKKEKWEYSSSGERYPRSCQESQENDTNLQEDIIVEKEHVIQE
jgi:hypothetical protein